MDVQSVIACNNRSSKTSSHKEAQVMTAVPTSSSLLLACVLIFSACSLPSSSVGSQAVSVASLFPSSLCSSSSSDNAVNNRKSTLSVIHRFGPCNRGSSSKDRQNHAQLLRQDDERVSSIQSKLSGIAGDQSLASSNVRIPAKSGSTFAIGNYVVTIGLGNPKKDLNVLFDTGSDLTWTQCRPCAGFCYNQTDQVFDPSQSSSYANVSCSSTTCSQIRSGTSAAPGCAGSACVYGVKYGDGSFTVGLFATERLTLSPAEVIENFQFGCGQNNRGLFGRVAGLIGLGRDRISLVEQTASKYGRYFSYCLPSLSSSLGHLSFGNSGGSSAFTPMITLSDPSFYGINLVGISVGGNKLSIPQTIFSNAGTVIDSGTTITRLPQTAYKALQAAFRQGMKNYTMVPAVSPFDTCYDFSKYDEVSIPKVMFTFGGGLNVDLDPTGILYVLSRAQVCLAFAGNADDRSVGIYGNTQQKTFEVTYDVAGGRIGFGPNGCQ
ncbi:hypothetical protein MLD38_015204 [Melastoma candidum]|uniref:Uncharacterized protein n=1 Tax=Melastoma candidum TaxID=119954 RepID=A0ACB9RFF9_9MYRT|nr:hypothetical protein MLD38_015204 [Melastoma candidum]